MQDEHLKARTEIMKILKERFNTEEIQDFCFRLGVNYEELKGENLSAKGRSLIDFLDRRNSLPDLVLCGQENRTDIDWQPIAQLLKIKRHHLHTSETPHSRLHQATIDCKGVPSNGWKSRDQFLWQTHANEWLLWEVESNYIQSLTAPGSVSQIISDTQHRLWVGLYEGALARLKNEGWVYHNTASAVTALATIEPGILVGELSGTVSYLTPNSEVVQSISLPVPVADILPVGNKRIVILGLNGSLWITKWPYLGSSGLQEITPYDQGIDYIYGIEPSQSASQIVLIGRRQITLFDLVSCTVAEKPAYFTDEIRRLTHNSQCYYILTDMGMLVRLSDDFSTKQPVQIPHKQVLFEGIATVSNGLESILAWSREGLLYLINKDEVTFFSNFADVATVHVSEVDGSLIVVCWNQEKGAQLKHYATLTDGKNDRTS